MLRYLAIAAAALGSLWTVSSAQAQATVECHSRNYQYDECYAGPLQQPQLVHQISSSACILNRSWGFNPNSSYIWVSQGCSGVFADVGGYHHGRGDGFDPGARQYDQRGRDVGAVVGGAVLGAIVAGITEGSQHSHGHTTSNYIYVDGHNRCQGAGCGRAAPGQPIDTTPQFDKEGEPNFDAQGNYQGCHGLGCLVDTPATVADAPPEPSEGQPAFSGPSEQSDAPPEPSEGQPEFTPPADQ